MGSDVQYCSESLITTDNYPENTRLRALHPSKHDHWLGDEWRGVCISPLGYEGQL